MWLFLSVVLILAVADRGFRKVLLIGLPIVLAFLFLPIIIYALQ